MKRILIITVLAIVGCLHLLAQSGSIVGTVQEGKTSESEENKESQPSFCPNFEATYLVYPPEDAGSVTVGINYYSQRLLRGPYIGMRIGWFEYIKDIHLNENDQKVKAERSIQGLTFPVEIGYAFSNKDISKGIIPFAAIDTSVSLKSRIKIEGEKKRNAHLSGNWTFHARVGVKFRIRYVNIGVYCALPLNKNFRNLAMRKPFPGITFGFGF